MIWQGRVAQWALGALGIGVLGGVAACSRPKKSETPSDQPTEVNLKQTTKQAAYNDLRLPVLWLHDRANPGRFDHDEEYIHPTLAAINELLGGTERKPIDPQTIIDSGLKFLAHPGARSSHPLLEKDLKSRGEPVFHFDLNRIPAGPYREATEELIKVVALADLYYKTQVEPDYLDYLRDIVREGDAVQIHHFWLRGRLGCIDPETAKDPMDCQKEVLPNAIPTRNGVWWSERWTQKDIDAIKKQLEGNPELKRKVFSPESRIVVGVAGEKDAFEYNGQYYKPAPMNSRLELDRIARLMSFHLKKAAKAIESQDPEYASMLRGRARYLRSDSLFADFKDDETWATVVNPHLSFSLARSEKYSMLGDPFGEKNVMQATLGYNDEALKDFVQGVVTLVPEANRRLAQLWHPKKPPFDAADRPLPTVEITNIIFNGGAGNAVDYVLGGFNQPNNDRYDREVAETEMKKRLVLFVPIVLLRIKNQGLPLAREAFDEETVRGIEDALNNPRAVASFTESHEIAHSQGVDNNVSVTVAGSKKKDTLASTYGANISKALEEGKGDQLGLFNLSLYVERDKMSPEDRKVAIYCYLGNGLRNLVLGEKDDHGLGFIYEWNLLVKHGVIYHDFERVAPGIFHAAELSTSGRFHFDLAQFEKELPTLTREYNDLYGSGNPARVALFNKEALGRVGPNTPIGQAIQKVRGMGGSKMDRPVYVVTGLKKGEE